jgi:hypothetical protein
VKVPLWVWRAPHGAPGSAAVHRAAAIPRSTWLTWQHAMRMAPQGCAAAGGDQWRGGMVIGVQQLQR